MPALVVNAPALEAMELALVTTTTIVPAPMGTVRATKQSVGCVTTPVAILAHALHGLMMYRLRLGAHAIKQLVAAIAVRNCITRVHWYREQGTFESEFAADGNQ